MFKKMVPVVLLLCAASTSYGLVIGNWENSLDGWFIWNPASATTNFSTTGVTLGFNSLQVTATTTYSLNLAIRLQDQGLVGDFLANTSFSIDVTWIRSEWSSPIAGDNWAVIDLIINASGVGQSNQSKPDIDSANTGYPGGWDIQNWGDNTRTVTWNYGHLLDGNPANGEITATKTSGYIELIIITTYASGFLPPGGSGGIYYFDNAQLIGGIYKTANEPYPSNGATDVRIDPTLLWKPGVYADTHDVYFGSDSNNVNNATAAAHPNVTFENIDVNSFKPGTLGFNTTYYWRVDEVNDAHIDELWKGDVWSFTTGNFISIDDFEDYNDMTNKIYDTWEDYFANNTGMTVGHFNPPFIEKQIFHSGYQSMYAHYDNDGTVNEGTDYQQSGTLLYSEARRQWTDPQDWTKDGIESLSLWFRGLPVSVGSFTQAGQLYTMTAGGRDIWDTADEFHFAYKQFSGVGSITAKINSVSNTHVWAKAGVMIRETLAANSKHVMMVVTPGNGVSLQHRPTIGAGTEQNTVTGVTAPQWVRLTRSGNTFTGEYSANGTSWQQAGSISMPLLTDVYIGFCLTSHNVEQACTAEYANVAINGTVTGDWQSQDIGIRSNIAEPMYVVLQDNTGGSVVVKHPDPAASAIGDWTQWSIPLTGLSGIDLKAVTSITIGVGDRANTQPRGSGDLYVDDIRLNLPAQPEPEPEPEPEPQPEPEPEPEPQPEPGPQPIDPGNAGLVAHYAFENNTEDSSGNGLQGTIVGNPIYTDGPAGFGTAMDFDGSGDYIDCGADPALDITGTITVAAWANIRSVVGNYVAVVAKGENAWRLSTVASASVYHFGITIWSAPYPSVNGITAVGTGEWHHVCGTYDGSAINLYLDGAIDSSLANTTTPIGISTTNLLIGENPEATGRYWNGLIDEVMIYNRALSRAEILYLMGQR